MCDFFGKSASQKQVDDNFQGDSSEHPASNNNKSLPSMPAQVPVFAAPVNYISTIAEKDSTTGSKSTDVAKKSDFEHELLVPFDLSLKTRCRFLSGQQFSCSMNPKSVHESESILNYAKFNSFYERLQNHKYVNKLFLHSFFFIHIFLLLKNF